MEAIAILAVVVCIVIACVVCTKRQHEYVKQRFPPISDAEFVALCGPTTNPDIALRVRRIVADQLGVEYYRIFEPIC